MAAYDTKVSAGLVVQEDQPLIGIPDVADGQAIVRYFASEADADAALSYDTLQDALALAGAWSHLDWEQTLDELDRIQHESTPTPPIDLDL
ncbi:MAG: hypothetical protein ACRDJW_19160 [Thermomicrobiales bacterium]